MKKSKVLKSKGVSDRFVILIIVLILGFTSITVSSGMMPTGQMNMDRLGFDTEIGAKEFQRYISVLNDDVCDDCDDDEGDTNKNQKPIAVIFRIEPNPAHEFDTIIFEGYGEDSDGTIIGYHWESSIDGTIGSNATISRSNLSSGVHNISFFVQDNQYLWSEPTNITVSIIENQPPSTPIIVGDSKMKKGVESSFTIISSDPEQHDVFYKVDWGDGSETEWLGSYQSNKEISVSHSWDQKGTYLIRAKAKDVHDAESSWGDHTVQLTRVKFSDHPLQQFIIRLLQQHPLISAIIG